jgi:hypothetical protein
MFFYILFLIFVYWHGFERYEVEKAVQGKEEEGKNVIVYVKSATFS